jgi:hypothetical protein
MEIIVTDGVSIKIADNEIMSWCLEKHVGISVNLKNGLRLEYKPKSKKIIFTDY